MLKRASSDTRSVSSDPISSAMHAARSYGRAARAMVEDTHHDYARRGVTGPPHGSAGPAAGLTREDLVWLQAAWANRVERGSATMIKPWIFEFFGAPGELHERFDASSSLR